TSTVVLARGAWLARRRHLLAPTPRSRCERNLARPVYLGAMLVTDATLDKLSFDRVRSALAERAGTFMGAELARALDPRQDEAAAERALERVQEVIDGGYLALGGIEDVRGLVRRVREGQLLEGSDILSIAYTLDGAATLRRAILVSERPALSEL